MAHSPRSLVGSGEDGRDGDGGRLGGTQDRADDGLGTQRQDRFPRRQIFILLVIRLCEPISFTVIFPMVAFMVADAKPSLSDKQIGFYTGAIESVFAFCQFLTTISWGQLSDQIGRKPVLLMGLIGVSIATVLFGFSRSFWQMMSSRALGGVLNGNAAVIKSMIGEVTTPDNQALAFSLLPTFFAIGCVVGPLLGGYLSQPSQKFPDSWLGRSLFWQNHPWLLPCVVAGFAPLVGFVMGLIWLRETLPRKPKQWSTERQPLLGSEEEEDGSVMTFVSSSRPDEQASGASAVDLLKDRNLVMILLNYLLLSFLNVALDAFIVLFAYTPVEAGGIGFSSSATGAALSVAGVMTLAVQVGLFPPLQTRWGTVKLYRVCMSAYPVIFLLFPLINLIAMAEERLGSKSFPGVWTGMIILLVLKTTANMVFSCNMLLVNAAAPTRGSLGTVNGLAQSSACLGRAVGPMVASSLFAVSIMHSEFLGGFTVFFLFAGLSLINFRYSLLVQDGGSGWRDT